MKLAQTFKQAVENPENWFLKDGMAYINWNFIDADCYMACGNEYPNPDAFYDEWNALCDIYLFTFNVHSLQMKSILEVDTVPA